MTESKILLIVNQTAKHGVAEALTPVIERLLHSVPHDTVCTTHPGHAAELAEAAEGYEAVIAVGGDGTVHEVVNGIMRRPEGSRPAFGLIPTGSGNDSRRTLGIPGDVSDAALLLASGTRRRFDVGVCNGTYFSNSFAAGLDARVTATAVEFKVTTRRSGLWLYLTALLHVLFRELKSQRVTLCWDGATTEERDVLIVAATIGKTYGGGFFITPDAVPDDGLLDTCIIDPLTLPQALARLPFVVTGKHTRMRPVHMARARSLVIDSDEPLPAQMDGEVAVGSHFEISILPQALECIVPRT